MSQLIKKILGFGPFRLSLVLVVVLILAYVVGLQFLELVELRALDLRFLLRGPVQPGPEVVIAVIDEKSVDEIGRWPWPRSTIAELTQILNADGAKSIAFDIGFFEPDRNTNLGLINRLDQQIQRLGVKNEDLLSLLERERKLADNDLILTQALEQATTPIILGYFFHVAQDETVTHITKEVRDQKIKSVRNGRYPFWPAPAPSGDTRWGSVSVAFMPEANIPQLAEQAKASGFFNMFPDADGTVRWVPMVLRCRDEYYLPLSLQALRFALGDIPPKPVVTEVGVEEIVIGQYHLPTDEGGRLLVNYRGPQGTFPHYSISDVLAGRLKKGTFKDKIVLVGATAVGIYDLRVTPFDSVFPGIEIHASVIDNILRQDFLVRPGWTAIYDIASIILIGIILGLALPRLSAMTGPLLGLFLLVVWVIGNYVLFTQGIWVNFIYPIITLVVVYTGITIYRYMTEEREKKKIKGAFSSYVNASVVDEMLKNPDMLKLGGDKRIATVMFSDIRGFTSISEKMDPEALVQLLNQYLTAMTDLVFKYDGLLDKYIGDAIMAVWGAPLPQPQHAVLACKTSLEMMSELTRLREMWAQEDPPIPFLDIGIGLNSGPMVVGNMGSVSRMDYTAMGDAVNLGSRLEGANKQYGTHIIIGDMTFAQINDQFLCRELDAVAVKGKAQPVRIHELLGEKGQVPEERLKMARAFHHGLTAYKTQHFDEAQRIFSAIHQYYPDDKPTQLYLERVAELKENPPPQDWDCVFVMRTK